MSDWQKRQWQAEETERESVLEAQRERERKARERSARNAKRKLARLQRSLTDTGEITDFESEFAESVGERLETYGAAFRDRELGRPGDALSAAQKRVVAQMNRKVKDAKRAAKNPSEAAEPRRRSSFQSKRSGFKSRRAYTPNVRQLDEGFEQDTGQDSPKTPDRPPVGKPVLRIITRHESGR